MTTIAETPSTTYASATASMQAVPAAPSPHGGGVPAAPASRAAAPNLVVQSSAAFESSLQAFPIQDARCATFPTQMEWVPDRESSVVPDLMAALCRRCPGRQTCLLWALAGNEVGYWAGTTTADRTQMRQLGQESIETAAWLQYLARQEATAGALHPEGDGSYRWYRKGCRCAQCRTANAAQRTHERAKSTAAGRDMTGVVAIGKTHT